MSKDKQTPSQSGVTICKDSGRGLPTTTTSTAMPQVKPPKTSSSSSNTNKK